MPLLWDDPQFDLLTLVVQEDAEDLLDEFDATLEELRLAMGSSHAESLSRRFQIVVGYNTLGYLLDACEKGAYCYRIIPGVERTPFGDMAIQTAANAYARAGHLTDAYELMQGLQEFPNGDPGFHRELGAYALEMGEWGVAKAELNFAKELQARWAHVYEQVIPAQGVISKPPEGMIMPLLKSAAEARYRQMRPECELEPRDQARLAGRIIGYLERARADLRDLEVVSVLAAEARAIQTWLNHEQDHGLLAILQQERTEAQGGRPVQLAREFEVGERAVERDEPSGPGELEFLVAVSCIRLGNVGGAIQAMQLAEAEGHPTAAIWMAMLFIGVGLRDEGHDALERASSLGLGEIDFDNVLQELSSLSSLWSEDDEMLLSHGIPRGRSGGLP